MSQLDDRRHPVTPASSDLDRIREIRSHRVVRYERFTEIVNELSALVDQPDARVRYRGVFSSSHNGKSTLSEELLRLFPRHENPLGDAVVVPVLRVSLSGIASVGELATRILENIGETFNPRSSRTSLLSSAYACLRAVQCRALILDEFQHVDAGHWRERLGLTNTIKEIGQACGLSVFAFGMPCSVEIIENEPQLSRRFEYLPLPRWRDDEAFRSLLHTLEAGQPLREKSDLAFNDELAEALLERTKGVFGFIYDLVEACGVTAVETGRERVDMKTLALTRWTPRQDRARRAKEEMGATPDELLPFERK